MYRFFTYIALLGILLTGCGQSEQKESVKLQEQKLLEQPQEQKEFVKPVEIKVEQNSEDFLVLETKPKPNVIPIISKEVDSNFTLPYFAPDIINIASDTFDSSFEIQSSNYFLDENASFDNSLKRSGNRSIRLSQNEDAVKIYNIPVTEGSWYIISGHMYVKSLPSDVVRFYTGYTNNGSHVGSVNYTLISISKAGEWEEFIVPLYVQKGKNIKDIKITIRNVGEPDTVISPVSDVWIDDLSVHKVKDSAHLFGFTKPEYKRAFEGSKVRVDSLGNFELKEDKEFKPFFPLIMYPGGNLAKFSEYKNKGFNTVVCHNQEEAEFAVSAGLKWVWSLYGYGIYDKMDNNSSGFVRFIREYEDMKKNAPHILDELLYFYSDNELYLLFDSFKIFSDQIKKMDVDEKGNRIRPIYMHLDFSAGNKNYYNESYQLIDIQGTYANPLLYQENDLISYGVEFKGNYNAEFSNFSMFENIPNIKIPKTIFVINSPQDTHIKSTIFAALARGGKGFAYWKDSGSQPEVETKSWWSDFSNVTSKIEKLKPLLRTPHWTNWELNYTLKDDEDGIIVGKRDYGSLRCIIASSRSKKSEIITFTTPNSDIGDVYNFFDGSVIAKGDGDSFSLSFDPLGSGVYCWDK